jgi:hypothetical protein
MASNNRYAALDTAALKAMSQLRSLSPSDDPSSSEKESLIQRLTAQDRVTAKEQGKPEDTYEPGAPEDKSWDWDFGDEPAAEKKSSWADEVADAEEEAQGSWEVVGARKPFSSPCKEDDVFGPIVEEEDFNSAHSQTRLDTNREQAEAPEYIEDIRCGPDNDSQEALHEESAVEQATLEQELKREPRVDIVASAATEQDDIPAQEPGVDIAVPSAADSKDVTVQQSGTTEAKKKRKRGKKGGKKVNKEKTTPPVSVEASTAVEEPLVEPFYTIEAANVEAIVAAEDPQCPHPSDSYLDDAETVVEPETSVSVAPTEVEVEDAVVGKDEECTEDIQDTLSSSAAPIKVDDTVVEMSDEEGTEDFQDTLSSNAEEDSIVLSTKPIVTLPAFEKVKARARPQKSKLKSNQVFDPTSRNFFDVLDTPATSLTDPDLDLDADDEDTITPPSDSAYDSLEPKKKSKARKRGKKGGKKVQKQIAAKELKKKKGVSPVLLGVAAALVGVVGYAVGILVKSKQ